MTELELYRTMYNTLFSGAAETLELLKERKLEHAFMRLQIALDASEDMFIDCGNVVPHLLHDILPIDLTPPEV